jgi:predicted cupin superfamily sugar epimerase
MAVLSAQDIIRMLALKPHPEGGHFRETFRDPKQIADGRSVSTAIYFLLARGERAHIASTPWKSGTGMPARRCSLKSLRRPVGSSA